MDEEYIDQFFTTGRLRLSSFKEFARHKDEARLDTQEGVHVLTGLSSDQTIFAVTRHGVRSYILSTSTIESSALGERLETSGRFRILNTTAFAAAIATCLGGFVDGLEGHCLYQDDRVIERQVKSIDLDALRHDPESLATLAQHVFSIGGADVFFVKLSRYASQGEYRFTWNVNHEVDGPIFVECPEAVHFCERVD